MIKNKLYALAGALMCSGAVLAEGETTFDFSTVITQMTSLKTALATFGTSALPVLAGIAGVFLVFWALRIGIRAVKSFASSGK